MGKITLEFDSIEEKDDALDALNGSMYKHSMYELDQYLRSQLKHYELSTDTFTAYEHIRDQIRDILHNNGITLE